MAFVAEVVDAVVGSVVDSVVDVVVGSVVDSVVEAVVGSVVEAVVASDSVVSSEVGLTASVVDVSLDGVVVISSGT